MKQILSFILLLSITSVFSQDIVMQQGTFYSCAPDKFFDSGGDSNNYFSNENFTTTICPQNNGDSVELNFTSFNTQQIKIH